MFEDLKTKIEQYDESLPVPESKAVLGNELRTNRSRYDDNRLVKVKAKYSTMCVDKATHKKAVALQKKHNRNGDAPMTLAEAVNEVLDTR
jgi:hypothetical protein